MTTENATVLYPTIQLDSINSNVIDLTNKVKQSEGSLFTKDDVLRVLSDIKVIKPQETYCLFNIKKDLKDLKQFVSNQFEELQNKADREFVSNGSFEIDNVTFEIKRNNEIELDTFDISFNGDLEIEDREVSIQGEIDSLIERIEANTLIKNIAGINTECQK